MARKRGMEDPFNDIERYSQKYKKQARRAPKLDARPYGAPAPSARPGAG